MQHFKINENQLKTLWASLVDFPASKVLPAIDILRSLPPIPEVIASEVPSVEEEAK